MKTWGKELRSDDKRTCAGCGAQCEDAVHGFIGMSEEFCRKCADKVEKWMLENPTETQMPRSEFAKVV